MSRKERPLWLAYGRPILMALLTVLAVVNGAYISGGTLLSVPSAAAALCGLALLGRRVPWFVAPVLVTAAAAVWGLSMLPLLLLTLADLAARRRAWIAVGCGVIALAANQFTDPKISLQMTQSYGSPLFLLLAVVCGLWLGSNRRLVEALNAQVEHLRIERELREEAARAAERSQIAAEMHDVLAHRLSLIALHTGVLATKADTLPETVADRLALLRTASTDALADLRDVLGALHHTEPDTTPAPPVLREVDELIQQAREAGQQVEIHTDGRPERAPTTHRLAVYHMVQEALSNARKHAQGAPVRIRLDYGPPATLVEVTNAPGTPATGVVDSGFGLVGLRERVTALGGDLTAGADGAGAWRLAARIPHPPAPEQNGSRA
ncbi:sensor histidine kinase [Streptomyces sp. NPDC001339]|uniref:sensor histidine kinase n=1 Tax=Streptomyces sp. NPDC001339 TaxID=3364563 RepID=UPI0036A3E972